MGFNLGNSAASCSVRTQNDIVAAQVESKPSLVSETMNLPGVSRMHLMSEIEFIEFLLMAIRVRPTVLGIEIVLGTYQMNEREATTPGITSFLDDRMPIEDKVRAIVNTLGAGQTVCGVRVTPLFVDGKLVGNRAYVYYTNKVPTGPTYDAEGRELTPGDEEFSPKLILTYKP